MDAQKMRIGIDVNNKKEVFVDLTGFDRIRERTENYINHKINRGIEERVKRLSGENKAVLSQSINQLEREWDLDRVILLVAAALGVFEFAFAVGKNKKVMLSAAAQTSMLFSYVVYGWSPIVSIFRRMGLRTRNEIDAERYALKSLRGDFDPLSIP